MASSHPTPARCQWFARLASALDRRSAPRFALLFLGAVLARGRRTVTDICRRLGPSFKAMLQVLEAFWLLIAPRANLGAGHRAALYQQVLRAIALHRVAARFGLSENAGYQPLGTRATVTASRRPCRSPGVSARSIEPPADRTHGPNALAAATRRRATARLH